MNHRCISLVVDLLRTGLAQDEAMRPYAQDVQRVLRLVLETGARLACYRDLVPVQLRPHSAEA